MYENREKFQCPMSFSFSNAVELDAGGEAVVDSGVDSEVSPSSPDEAEDAEDATATAAASATDSAEQGCPRETNLSLTEKVTILTI